MVTLPLEVSIKTFGLAASRLKDEMQRKSPNRGASIFFMSIGYRLSSD